MDQEEEPNTAPPAGYVKVQRQQPQSVSLTRPEPKPEGTPYVLDPGTKNFLAILALVPVVLLCMAIAKGSSQAQPATQSLPVQVESPAGKVDASGRIYVGTKLYSSTGAYFGVVTQQVVRDGAGEEFVEVRLADGSFFKLKRQAIRQGKTWFTDP